MKGCGGQDELALLHAALFTHGRQFYHNKLCKISKRLPTFERYSTRTAGQVELGADSTPFSSLITSVSDSQISIYDVQSQFPFCCTRAFGARVVLKTLEEN